jgi:hypothetical protein
MLQLVLHMHVPPPQPIPARPEVICDRCGQVMTILARMVTTNLPMLC